ncbi:MAG: hypothetical protein RL368_224 [Pseudomonadota bacterium]
MIYQVAVPTPLDQVFDYLPPENWMPYPLAVGMRVLVPFGNRVLGGLIVAIQEESDCPPEKLKAIRSVLDKTPLFNTEELALLQWVSRYYHYPLGEVLDAALPSLLRSGKTELVKKTTQRVYSLSSQAREFTLETLPLKKNTVQHRICSLLWEYSEALSREAILQQIPNTASNLSKLVGAGWLIEECRERKESLETFPQDTPPELNPDQRAAVTKITDSLDKFFPCVLDGVTGSGKTEVYLQVIAEVLAQQRQALVLVPEINLTPQMLQRFRQRFPVKIAVLHSQISPPLRLQAWRAAQSGAAQIVIGTRSAVWTSFANLGVIVVDEEHDLSYKQQDSLRYSARDVAMVRAQRTHIPIILGSATPCLETLYNAQQGRYTHLSLPERAGSAAHPSVKIVDMRQQPRQLLSKTLYQAIKQRLSVKQQVLLFMNRRGYAPTLTCYHCGWVAHCLACSANLTYHAQPPRLECHHCGVVRPLDIVCPECQHTELHFLGRGTERIEEDLQALFPESRILRIDSDSTRQKQKMQGFIDQIHAGEADILIGTQMLAKGHHFPQVTLVGVLNCDGGLFNVDFRGSEHLAQMLVQVSGRAGREAVAGEVILQTYHPEHALFQHLLQQGYPAFAEIALQERREANLPPYGYLALLRTEAENFEKAVSVLQAAKTELNIFSEIELWGPVRAPMEKRAHFYRAQLLLQSVRRDALHQGLRAVMPNLRKLANAQKVRFSLDIDPLDLL